jgi:hypothetical protein
MSSGSATRRTLTQSVNEEWAGIGEAIVTRFAQEGARVVAAEVAPTRGNPPLTQSESSLVRLWLSRRMFLRNLRQKQLSSFPMKPDLASLRMEGSHNQRQLRS